MTRQYKKKGSALKEAQDLLGQYQQFYPDATMTTMRQEGGFCNEEMMDVIARVAKMTSTAVLYVMSSGDRAYLIKSKHFMTVADKLAVKGTKVRFVDPRMPYKHAEGVIVEDGIYYVGGAACLHLECKALGLAKNDITFALFWQPVK